MTAAIRAFPVWFNPAYPLIFPFRCSAPPMAANHKPVQNLTAGSDTLQSLKAAYLRDFNLAWKEEDVFGTENRPSERRVYWPRMPLAKQLEVRDLRKQFGSIAALRGVSFEVEPGEVFGYLGPNGAGKTTTLRIALGLVRPASGAAFVFGQTASHAACRHNIGFLPGDLRLYGSMTAIATLDFFARFRPSAPPVLRDSLIDALGVDGATLGRRIKFLSHGTRQKIGLIAAMQHDPALLLLDEPSNGLDPLVQHAFREIVRNFAGRGRSVLLSSHVLSEVETVCRRVAILKEGEIVALETIDNLRDRLLRKLTVRFRREAPRLSDVPGVARSEVNGRVAVLWVRGDVNPLLRTLAQAEIDEMVFPEPQLEDIFLSYYQNA